MAPKGYIEGVTLVFARALCHPERADVQIVSAPPASAPPASAPPASAKADDALAVYKSDFARLGMRIDRTGPETLRHSYALLLGLGMMESSGIYCEGRDVSECFASADSAEAGLFQTSYGARVHSPALTWLFQQFSADQTNCLLPVFAGPVCHIAKSHNAKCPNATSGIAGTGPGADWQKLTKSCPAFAVEYGAVVLRTHGGSKGEFNPIRKHQAELSVDCDAMLQDAQAYVSQHSDACPLL